MIYSGSQFVDVVVHNRLPPSQGMTEGHGKESVLTAQEDKKQKTSREDKGDGSFQATATVTTSSHKASPPNVAPISWLMP